MAFDDILHRIQNHIVAKDHIGNDIERKFSAQQDRRGKHGCAQAHPQKHFLHIKFLFRDLFSAFQTDFHIRFIAMDDSLHSVKHILTGLKGQRLFH